MVGAVAKAVELELVAIVVAGLAGWTAGDVPAEVAVGVGRVGVAWRPWM